MFSFFPIGYFLESYLYLMFGVFISKLHLNPLIFYKNRGPVKASDHTQTWHSGWCNHVGSDLFSLNRVSFKGNAGFVFQFLFMCSLPPTETEL